MKKTLLAVLVAVLAGCPRLPPTDNCAPAGSMGCTTEGRPFVCTPEGRKAPLDTRCTDRGLACCLAPSPYGRPAYACTPLLTCVGAN